MSHPVTFIVQEVSCPNCGASELTDDGERLLIRGFKVHDQGHWWSQCLVCAGFYPQGPQGPFDQAAGNDSKGWF